MVGLHYSAVSLSKLNAGKRIASIAEQSPLIARLARGIGKQPQNRTSTDPSERVWSNIKDTRSKAVLQTFIRNYPNSIYLDFAKARFRELAALDASADQTGGGQLDLSVSNQDEPEGTRSDSSLSGPALASAVQKELKRIGCYQGSIDGDWGRGSAGAVSLYNKMVNANWGRAPSQELLVELYGIAKLPVCKKALNGTANRFDGHWMVNNKFQIGVQKQQYWIFLD